MSKLNHVAAPNLNLGSKVLRTSNLISDKANHEFSEELSDGGERNEIISRQKKQNRK